MSKVFHQTAAAAAFILSEANGHRSREGVTIGPEQEFEAGTVLALMAQAGGVTTDAAAVDGNTGDGTIAMADPAVNSKAKNGVYSVIFTDETAFKVEDPNGVEIGIGAPGAAFNKEVKFTITAGATAFAAGDRFTITVGVENPGDYQAVAYNPNGSDGSEKASAIAIYPAKTGKDETVSIAAIFRDAEVNSNCIAWPEGITAEKKAAAIADLAAVGILVR